MSKKNKDQNRRGFFNYLHTIRRTEADKDAFCRAARIPRNGYDQFSGILNELTKRHGNWSITSCEYLRALDKIREMIESQNAHELKMAEIADGKDTAST